MNNSRREALIGISGLALVTTSTLFAANESKEENIIPVPWEYKKLDPDIVAVRAYRGYHQNGCMHATFEAIVGELGDQFGSPYSTFPFEMMKYGSGGVAGWGTLCGTLNGAAAAIGLLSKNPKKLIDELYRWHEVTSLPNVDLSILTDKERIYPSPTKVTSTVSGSVLCHVVITKWLKESGNRLDSSQKIQRCSQTAASVAKKTVELLNAELDGTFKTQYPFSKKTKSCFMCHAGASSMKSNSTGKMQCITCHTDLSSIHAK